MGWQWHQLDHMQIICTSLQTDNHVSTSSVEFFYRPDALPADQRTVSKHGGNLTCHYCSILWLYYQFLQSLSAHSREHVCYFNAASTRNHLLHPAPDSCQKRRCADCPMSIPKESNIYSALRRWATVWPQYGSKSGGLRCPFPWEGS